MSAIKASGTPITGTCQLTNAAPGPTAFTLQQVSGGATYALKPGELVVITHVSISSNDPAGPLVTVDDGPTAGSYVSRVLAKAYAGSTYPASTIASPVGNVGRRGVNPRASAPAVTAAKTVEITCIGYVTSTT